VYTVAGLWREYLFEERKAKVSGWVVASAPLSQRELQHSASGSYWRRRPSAAEASGEYWNRGLSGAMP
jgi:hypothetical protein